MLKNRKDPPPLPPSSPYPPRLNGLGLLSFNQSGEEGRIFPRPRARESAFRVIAFFPYGCVVFILPPSPDWKKEEISIKDYYIFFLVCRGRIEKTSSPYPPPKSTSYCFGGQKSIFGSSPDKEW